MVELDRFQSLFSFVKNIAVKLARLCSQLFEKRYVLPQLLPEAATSWDLSSGFGRLRCLDHAACIGRVGRVGQVGQVGRDGRVGGGCRCCRFSPLHSLNCTPKPSSLLTLSCSRGSCYQSTFTVTGWHLTLRYLTKEHLMNICRHWRTKLSL